MEQNNIECEKAQSKPQNYKDDLSINEVPQNQKQLDVRATESLAAYCFAILHKRLYNTDPPAIPDELQAFHEANVKIPLFITWMKKHNNLDEYNSLRGCIGCLKPLPIMDIEKYAIKSAFDDPRFSPISHSELEQLECKVQLLCQYERCDHPYDWEIETHGITIYFKQGDVAYSSTFLPGIALEHMMTKRETLTRLIQKAKFQGEISDQLIDSLSVVRYQSSKATITYVDYKSLYHHYFFVAVN